MDIVGEVNQQILELWKREASKLQKIDRPLLKPLLYPQLKQNVLLFVSLNPSFVPKEYSRILGITESEIISFLSWDSFTNVDIDKCVHLERQMRDKYKRFFGVFEKIAEKVTGDKSKYEHSDLFFYRQTKQQDFKKQILNNSTLDEFIKGQPSLSKHLIEWVNPEAIIVANVTASNMFKEEFTLEWSEEFGSYTTLIGNKHTPVFLSSMLSEQGALDIYSRERLEWQIKKALREY